MLEDWRQEEIKGEVIQTEFMRQQFEVARGLNASLSQDEESKKWIYLSNSVSGVGDSPQSALNDLWNNFHSKDYGKEPF